MINPIVNIIKEVVEKKRHLYDDPDRTEILNYVRTAMSRGENKLTQLYGGNKSMFYYAMVSMAIALRSGREPTREELEVITELAPSVINFLLGIIEEAGLSDTVQYSIYVGNNKGEQHD